MANTLQITRDMTIEEILTQFPQYAQHLTQEMRQTGLNCVGCQAAVWETLEGGVLGHGHSEEVLIGLLDRLNRILKTPLETMGIKLTKKAAVKFLELLEEDGKQGWALRFGDRAAGCHGFEYILDYSQKPSSDDTVYHSEGIEIHVNSTAAKRLEGSIIDYIDGLQGSGFKITNPHVRGSCHCGNSQSY